MNILLTNDDGIFSPGLAAAAEVAAKFGDIYIAAPSRQKTGSGRGYSGDRDQSFVPVTLEIGGEPVQAYHLDATPALVVKHSFSTIFRDIQFDAAVSGVNYGENIGYDITISGTVGAAVECAAAGIPAFAVSLQTAIENHLHYGDVDWCGVQFFLKRYLERLIENGGFSGFDILKIDVPESADRNTPPVRASLSKKSYFETFVESPRGDARLSDVNIRAASPPFDKESDAYVLRQEAKVSVVPLSLDWSFHGESGFFSERKQ